MEFFLSTRIVLPLAALVFFAVKAPGIVIVTVMTMSFLGTMYVLMASPHYLWRR